MMEQVSSHNTHSHYRDPELLERLFLSLYAIMLSGSSNKGGFLWVVPDRLSLLAPHWPIHFEQSGSLTHQLRSPGENHLHSPQQPALSKLSLRESIHNSHCETQDAANPTLILCNSHLPMCLLQKGQI